MRSLFAFFAIMALTVTSPRSALSPDEKTASDLVGTWDVSLFFSASQPPSETTMVISAVEDGALTGTFYGSAFEAGRARAHKGEVVFTVTTKDGSGLYATSGRLGPDNVVRGQTLSVGRDFIMAWEAERRAED